MGLSCFFVCVFVCLTKLVMTDLVSVYFMGVEGFVYACAVALYVCLYIVFELRVVWSSA